MSSIILTIPLILVVVVTFAIMVDILRPTTSKIKSLESSSSENSYESTNLYPPEIQSKITDLTIPLTSVVEALEEWIDAGEPSSLKAQLDSAMDSAVQIKYVHDMMRAGLISPAQYINFHHEIRERDEQEGPDYGWTKRR